MLLEPAEMDYLAELRADLCRRAAEVWALNRPDLAEAVYEMALAAVVDDEANR